MALDEQGLRRSVEEFHQLFAGGEGVVHSSSAAMLLQQHLSMSGFRTSFSVNDVSAIVAAVAEATQESGDHLIEFVEDCLRDLAAFNRSTQAAGFTIHRIATPQIDARQAMIVEFINAAEDGNRHVLPLALPEELIAEEQTLDFDDDLDGIDLF